MATTPRRADALGRAYAGSQLQVQIYVNRRSEELSAAIVQALPSLTIVKPRLCWVSPLEDKRFAEYQDEAFLQALELGRLADSLRTFWPRGGPVWDALALVEQGVSTARGVLLVEAKSHPSEVYGQGCRASPVARAIIEEALRATKNWLGVPAEADWTGPLYQSANRLAHVYFFREVAGVSAWLANVYFVNDPHSPASLDDWRATLPNVKAELGLAGIALPCAADVFLPARSRTELAGDEG